MFSRQSFLFLLLLGSVFSCDNNRVYEANVEFKDRSWKVIEEPRFDFNISDTSSTYNIYYNVRNSLDYPNSRIFVTWHLYDSSGRELVKKLVFNHLFDEKTGRPLGDSGLGDLYDHRFPILEKYSFSSPGKFSFKLDQFSRQDTLQGIIAVGVRVEKNQR
jgi:gliding motility-associated lipoprotein GldH